MSKIFVCDMRDFVTKEFRSVDENIMCDDIRKWNHSPIGCVQVCYFPADITYDILVYFHQYNKSNNDLLIGKLTVDLDYRFPLDIYL